MRRESKKPTVKTKEISSNSANVKLKNNFQAVLYEHDV